MSDPLDDWLAEDEERNGLPTCKICTDFDLVLIVDRFLDAKKDGKTEAPLGRFHSDCIVLRMKRDVGETTLRRHVQYCLRRDHKTGKAL